jgi:transposase-like protein
MKYGRQSGKQCYLCKDCNRQFVEFYQRQRYPIEVKKNCLTLYLNGMGFRGIERAAGVCHSTVIIWVKQAASTLPNPPEPKRTPAVAQLEELQTFIQRKKQDLDLDGS